MAEFNCLCRYKDVCRSLPDDLTCEEVERIAMGEKYKEKFEDNETEKMSMEKVGKHEALNMRGIKNALSGACFHGEVWVYCPYCRESHELVGKKPLRIKDNYRIFQCEKCGKLFKDLISI